MNFTVFSTGSTNIWPLTNDSHWNGQLMTEYNLRSRESVGTDETVQYMYGPSYCHSEEDFKVQCQTDGTGTQISSTVLEITPGRALVNGHFIESLSKVTIDILDANTQAQLEDKDILSGSLCVGLRAMYSTEETMAGSMLADKEEFYEGIQVVILPKSEFILPEDSPYDQDQVTAHLLLATCNFMNGAINTVVENYPKKCQWIQASRIENVSGLLSDVYVKKSGLNPKKLYTFAGKGTDPETGLDTWCDSLDSLMVWDNDPRLTTEKPVITEAQFGTSVTGVTQLVMPHKQVDGMTNSDGQLQYYDSKTLSLPLADFNAGTAGTVNKNYTGCIKEIANKVQNYYRLPNGKQVGYLDYLNQRKDIPTLNNNWDIGDYIVVGTDFSVYDDGADSDGETQAPCTMYVVIPGQVRNYEFHSETLNDPTIPADLTGIELAVNTMSVNDGDFVDTEWPDIYLEYFDLTETVRGLVGKDYFVVCLVEEIYGDEEHPWRVTQTNIYRYYFVVTEADSYQYTDPPIWVTGEIPLATDETIGGFYNVSDTDLDNGYVYRDSTGHLVLLDYSLLRSGTLAYQLGEDYSIPAGVTAEEIQDYLDDYVNDRVAFPNSNQIANHSQDSDTPYVITVTIPLSEEDSYNEETEEEEELTINIHGLDSRFGTSVYLYFTGTASPNITINIYNCEKIRIYSNIGGSPTINLYNCGLYYDASVINRLNDIENMSLWYERFDDSEPNLLVNDMTVRECDAAVISSEIDYWKENVVNDNHYMFALQSLTFGPDGTIVGAGLYVRNETTANLDEGDCIVVSDFELPQGAGLEYPPNRLTKQIKITGTFVNAYAVSNPDGYMVIDTNFSALTNAYDAVNMTNVTGNVAFHAHMQFIDNIVGIDVGTAIDSWESNAFHYFYGVCIG